MAGLTLEPSGEKARYVTGAVWPSSTFTTRPETASHSALQQEACSLEQGEYWGAT